MHLLYLFQNVLFILKEAQGRACLRFFTLTNPVTASSSFPALDSFPPAVNSGTAHVYSAIQRDEFSLLTQFTPLLSVALYCLQTNCASDAICE